MFRNPTLHPRTGQPMPQIRKFGPAAVLVFVITSIAIGALFGFRPGTLPEPAAKQSSSTLALRCVPYPVWPGFLGRAVLGTGVSFPNPGMPAGQIPSFFPISVFMGKPEHAAALKALGINTYMGAEHDGSSLSSITKQGIFVLPQDEWTQSEVGDDTQAVGWFISDECDMGIGCTGSNPAENLADQISKVERVHACRRRPLHNGKLRKRRP